MDTYTEDCKRCEGTGTRVDPTLADKVNQGPNPHQCTTCKGNGHRTLVKMEKFPSAGQLGAIPVWDPAAVTPDWMLGR